MQKKGLIKKKTKRKKQWGKIKYFGPQPKHEEKSSKSKHHVWFFLHRLVCKKKGQKANKKKGKRKKRAHFFLVQKKSFFNGHVFLYVCRSVNKKKYTLFHVALFLVQVFSVAPFQFFFCTFCGALLRIL